MVHPSHVFFSPNIKIKVGKLSQLNKKDKELFSVEINQSRKSVREIPSVFFRITGSLRTYINTSNILTLLTFKMRMTAFKAR